MIERRTDIWELESRLKAAFYGREAARKDRFPSLVLTGQLGQVSTQLNELLNQSSRNYELGAGILQTLFDGGRKRAVVRAADAKCAAVQAAYEQAVLNAFREIRDALVERRKSTEVYEATLDEVNCLRRSWDIASRQYEAGYVGLMDALDTHRQGSRRRMAAAPRFRMRDGSCRRGCPHLLRRKFSGREGRGCPFPAGGGEKHGTAGLSNYLLAFSLTGLMLASDVRGLVSRCVSVGHALRNFRIFTGCQAGKTGPERLIHLGCAPCRADSVPLHFWEKAAADNTLPEALPVPDAIQASRPEPV